MGRWADAAKMGETWYAYRISVGKLLGESPTRRPRRRCKGNIKMFRIMFNGVLWY
jgi:hypothetical protein